MLVMQLLTKYQFFSKWLKISRTQEKKSVILKVLLDIVTASTL